MHLISYYSNLADFLIVWGSFIRFCFMSYLSQIDFYQVFTAFTPVYLWLKTHSYINIKFQAVFSFVQLVFSKVLVKMLLKINFLIVIYIERKFQPLKLISILNIQHFLPIFKNSVKNKSYHAHFPLLILIKIQKKTK